MGDMLSQEEINALLGGASFDTDSPADSTSDNNSSNTLLDPFSAEQKDILGEIGNISMGTAATTLFMLLNQKVWITTPKVKVINWKDLAGDYDRPYVGIKVDYKEGLKGSNVLVLKERDVKVIANLMMGGDGISAENEPLNDLDLSAISEAMNQMVGSSATSLSSLVKMKIDIDTPRAFVINFDDDEFFNNIGFGNEGIASIAFRMEIGTLIDSEIMQILPVDFALQMVETLKKDMMASVYGTDTSTSTITTPPVAQPQVAPQSVAQQQTQQQQQQPMYYQEPQQQMYYQPQQQQQPMYYQPQQQQSQPQQNVNVQAAQFQSFDAGAVMQQKENIGIIMDVPLEVTVELGRTHKLIKEILEFSPGTIIELDKLAGEPIDILVNGKFVAKGEVVVIDENFGIRITDIISVENRI